MKRNVSFFPVRVNFCLTDVIFSRINFVLLLMAPPEANPSFFFAVLKTKQKIRETCKQLLPRNKRVILKAFQSSLTLGVSVN